MEDKCAGRQCDMKRFHVTGNCVRDRHYMVDTTEKINTIIEDYIQQGSYFTINQARQYGKTTTLLALAGHLKKEHTVVSLDFQLFSAGTFRTENTFSLAFAKAFVQSWKENRAPFSDEIC